MQAATLLTPRELTPFLLSVAPTLPVFIWGPLVPLVRVVQCDAGVHDMGYVEPEELTGRVQVRGRGGTVLMPAIRLLEESASFPRETPVLIITDGMCDQLSIRPNHAYLMPEGARLPFHTRSPIFHFDDRN
jgi:hypothetical protein